MNDNWYFIPGIEKENVIASLFWFEWWAALLQVRVRVRVGYRLNYGFGTGWIRIWIRLYTASIWLSYGFDTNSIRLRYGVDTGWYGVATALVWIKDSVMGHFGMHAVKHTRRGGGVFWTVCESLFDVSDEVHSFLLFVIVVIVEWLTALYFLSPAKSCLHTEFIIDPTCFSLYYTKIEL